MMSTRRRLLMQSKKASAAETIVVYDYDTAPQTLNGTVLSGSYTELGSAGLKMRVIGSDSLSCVIGTYDLTGYTMLEVVGGKKDYAISTLSVAIRNAVGAILKTLDLKSVLASNDMSNFTAANGSYSTHYLDLSDVSGECSIKLAISASGTTQTNVVAYKYIAFLASGSTDPTVDRITVTGAGDETSGYVMIDGTKIYQTTVLDVAHGAHTVKAAAYRIVINGAEYTAGSTDALIEREESISGNITVTIEKTTESGIFGNTYYTITIT